MSYAILEMNELFFQLGRSAGIQQGDGFLSLCFVSRHLLLTWEVTDIARGPQSTGRQSRLKLHINFDRQHISNPWRNEHPGYYIYSRSYSHADMEFVESDALEFLDEIKSIFPEIKEENYLGYCQCSYPAGCNGGWTVFREKDNGSRVCDKCSELLKYYDDTTLDKIDGYVYLIGSETFGVYKIGCSNNPKSRISDTRKAVPFPIGLLHQMEVSDKFGCEKWFHELYKKERMKGEWFHLSEKQVEDIKKIKRFSVPPRTADSDKEKILLALPLFTADV